MVNPILDGFDVPVGFQGRVSSGEMGNLWELKNLGDMRVSNPGVE